MKVFAARIANIRFHVEKLFLSDLTGFSVSFPQLGHLTNASQLSTVKYMVAVNIGIEDTFRDP